MKTNGEKRFIFFILLFFMIQFFSFQSIGAEENTKVRVGFYNNSFHYENSDGTYGGYGYEYLQELAKYTGWDYEFIPGSLKECHERLKKGEIDLLGAVQKTQEREEYLAYPKLSSGVSYAVLCVKNSNIDYAYNDYEAFNGKRVGLLEGSNNNILFEKFCNEKNISLKHFYYANQEQLSNALYQGKVDLILSNSIRKNESKNEKIVAQFAPSEFYFTTYKGNTKILSKLNEAQEQIKLINPNFDSFLYEKYYLNKNSKDFVLTKEEKQSVFEMNAIRVAVLSNLKPMQMYDEKTNDFSGISVDVLELISNITGIQFDFIPVDDYNNAIALLKEQKADMICGIPKENTQSKEDSIVLSSPYLQVNMVMAKNRKLKNRNDLTVAMVKDEDVPINLDHFSIVYYDTMEECVNAVNSQEADICYGNIYVIEKMIQNSKVNNISLSAAVNLDSSVCFAFGKPTNTKFVTLFNKALHYVSDNEIQEIIYNNTLTKDYKMTIHSILYMRPDIVVFAVAAISTVILLFVIYVFYSRMKTQKLMAKNAMIQEERYRVATEISNDILFEYDIESDVMTNASKYTEIFGREPVLPSFLESKQEMLNVHKEDWTVFEEFCLSLKSGSDMVESEFRILEKGGDYVWCHLRGKTIFNKKNEPIKIIGKIINIDIQKRELEKLLFKAQRDPLTNLYNKVKVKDLINRSIEEASFKNQFSLMIIDIDNFKLINDTYGHLLGDKVLTEIVKSMKTVFDKEDIAGRIGGDEFVIFVCNENGNANVCRKAKRLGEAVYGSNIEEDRSVKVTISIGIANYPEDGKTYDELLEHADRALYCVKNKGKNNFDFYMEKV